MNPILAIKLHTILSEIQRQFRAPTLGVPMARWTRVGEPTPVINQPCIRNSDDLGGIVTDSYWNPDMPSGRRGETGSVMISVTYSGEYRQVTMRLVVWQATHRLPDAPEVA